MADHDKRPSVSVGLAYKDPKRAYKWLEEAFGFEPDFVILSKDGDLMHSEMRFGDGIVMVGSEWDQWHKSPASVGGVNTQSVHVHMTGDVDAHCERARKAGAKIEKEPETQFYGDRAYRAVDFEGHHWSFSQTVKVMSQDEWDKEGDVVTRKRLD